MHDTLTQKGIVSALDFFADVEVFDTVDSTNAVAAARMGGGCGPWHTIIARSQTGGEGRLGRSFFSPSDTGIYMSCVLYPEKEKLGLITGMAAVAVSKAMEKLGFEPGIKWVNDIFINGKKVCGILAKSRAAGDRTGVILGIGVNVYPPAHGFPNDITSSAGYLAEKQREGLKDRLSAAILNELFAIIEGESCGNAPEEYRKRCITVGRSVTVIPSGDAKGKREARALYVDDSYRLGVRYSDGQEELLFSGEVSVRFDV